MRYCQINIELDLFLCGLFFSTTKGLENNKLDKSDD